MAQMTRPGGIHILYVVSLIKRLFSLFFNQKCEKLHYALWQLLRAITRAPLKIRARCLHQTGGFRGRPIEWCPSNLPLTDPCCHGNQPPLFEHKIGNNSACIGDTTPIPAPSWELSGAANLSVLMKYVLDQPLLPWQRKSENFNRKFAISRLIKEIYPPFLHQTWGFLLKILNFRYYGNGSWSETNFTAAIKMVDPENPLFGAKIGDISPV